MILDACRNNPLARSSTGATYGGDPHGQRRQLRRPERGPAGGRDAGRVCGGGGNDGGGRAGPEQPSYATTALLSHLETPLEIGLLFRRVRAQVLASTNGAQRPHEYHSLVGEHYLTRTLATGAAVTVTAAVPVDPVPADPPRPDPRDVDVTELPIVALRELAEAGDTEAQAELGERYEEGRGVGRDYGVAMSWFRRAAERGYGPAQAALGYMYSAGRGGVGPGPCGRHVVVSPSGRTGECVWAVQPRGQLLHRPRCGPR